MLNARQQPKIAGAFCVRQTFIEGCNQSGCRGWQISRLLRLRGTNREGHGKDGYAPKWSLKAMLKRTDLKLFQRFWWFAKTWIKGCKLVAKVDKNQKWQKWQEKGRKVEAAKLLIVFQLFTTLPQGHNGLYTRKVLKITFSEHPHKTNEAALKVLIEGRWITIDCWVLLKASPY